MIKKWKQYNEEFNEEIPDLDEKESSHCLVCPYCEHEQETSPTDVFMDNHEFADYCCEACGEDFECSQSVVYTTRKK